MAKSTKLTEEERKALVREWSNTPSPNPRYQGLTPAEVAKALRKPPRKTQDTGQSSPATG